MLQHHLWTFVPPFDMYSPGKRWCFFLTLQIYALILIPLSCLYIQLYLWRLLLLPSSFYNPILIEKTFSIKILPSLFNLYLNLLASFFFYQTHMSRLKIIMEVGLLLASPWNTSYRLNFILSVTLRLHQVVREILCTSRKCFPNYLEHTSILFVWLEVDH